ncbi:Uncharacterised protein [Segatella copri]|nr:Uncharacterised protein [Segatella copri]
MFNSLASLRTKLHFIKNNHRLSLLQDHLINRLKAKKDKI